MFITVWLGILELSTGKILAANAGHEYPAVYRNGKGFELLKDKHGFVVGGMSGVHYKDYELTLKPGEALFLYTDGVPEATSADNELFGVERMVKALNVDPEGTPEEILANVQDAVDKFVDKAPQFDDLTMLCVRYRGSEDVNK
jgi:sigma-B regulation protein RsbU (phosphoserine phosphatase)